MARKDHIPAVTPKELKKILEFLDKLDNPPALMIFGIPGIGKTTIVKKFVEEKGYELRVRHLSRMDPTDWTGIPKNDPEDPYTSFRPISLFRPSKDGRKIVIFFDELNTALPQVLNSALDVILEKRGDVETYGKEATLPENTIIVAAGNLGTEEDGTYVEEFSTAVKTRLIQVVLEQNNDDWLEWAKENSIHYLVISFIESHPSYLVDITGFKQNWEQIPTPRGWERVSNYIKQYEKSEKDMKYLKYLILGTLGKKIGEKFCKYLEVRLSPSEDVYKQLEKYENLFNNPSSREIGRAVEYLRYISELFEWIENRVIYLENEQINSKVTDLLKIVYSNVLINWENMAVETLRTLYVGKAVRDYIINKLGLTEYDAIFCKIGGAL